MNQFNFPTIIPHKNSTNLLQYCLDSISLHDDIQVIVVEDDNDVDSHFDYLEIVAI